MKTRLIYEIAREITADWKRPYFGAVPYIDAMRQLAFPDEKYGVESGRDIVERFLSNAQLWKGETARRIKVELREMTER